MRVEGREAIAEVTISVAPSLLGFSIGAMAIVLAFSGSKFFKVLSEKGRDDSAYIDLTSKFVHFILVQCIAIVLALLSKLQPGSILFAFLTTLALAYALATAVATALALFGTARIYNTVMRLGDDSEAERNAD
jgi:Fe2+ transport system protein B